MAITPHCCVRRRLCHTVSYIKPLSIGPSGCVSSFLFDPSFEETQTRDNMQKWKRFTFFKKELRKDSSETIRGLDITSCIGWGPKKLDDQTSDDPSFLIFGDSDGILHMVDVFSSGGKRSVRAFSKRVNLTFAANSVFETAGNKSRMLLTLGNAPDSRSEEERTFAAKVTAATFVGSTLPKEVEDVEAVDDGKMQLKLFRVTAVEGLKLENSIPLFPLSDDIDNVTVVCCTALDDLSQVAVGLSNGNVIVYRGNLLKSKKGSYDRIVIENAPGEVVKSLHLFSTNCLTGTAPWAPHSEVTLFAVSNKSTKSYRNLSQRRQKLAELIKYNTLEYSSAPTIAGEEVHEPHTCSCLTERGLLVVCRDHGIFMYDAEVSQAMYSLEGPKASVFCYQQYLCLVTVERGMHRLSVYDLTSKFVALTMTLRSGAGAYKRRVGAAAASGQSNSFSPHREELELKALLMSDGQVSHLMSAGGLLFLVTTTRRLYCLEEKNLADKLGDLYKKHMYSVALKVASGTHIDNREIYVKSANHLYNKGDFDQSVQEYIETIGYLESSRVIRKFLGAQQIGNLAAYLEAYHRHPEAELSTNHTTLLLKCFTKMKSVEKLKDFIGYGRIESLSGAQSRNSFKSENTVCFDVHTAIAVLCEAGYSSEALFLAKKDKNHKEYIKIQLEIIRDWNEALHYIGKIPLLEAGKTLKLYGMLLLEKKPEETTEMLMEMCTRAPARTGYKGKAALADDSLISALEAENFISLFVDHPCHLKRFLWKVVKGPVIDESHITGSESKLVWNTLVELCLRVDIAKKELTGQRSSVEGVTPEDLVVQETMMLLQDAEAKYDMVHTLVKVQQARCNEGLLYLYEKQKMYSMMLQHYMDIGDNRAVLRTCKKLGDRNPHIWVKVLNYFARMDSPECDPYILQVLQYAKAGKTLPILLVINILSKNSNLPVSIIQDYISAQLTTSNENVSETAKEVARLKTSTIKLNEQITNLKTKGLVFQNNKCHLTEHSLETPTVHFMTGFSYGVDNIPQGPDGELECPIKGPEHRRIWETQDALKKKIDHHEEFFRELSHATKTDGKGLKVVGEYFGRAIL